MKPTWWLLYAIGFLLVGLLALVEIFVPRGGAQSVLEITGVIGSFGLMALWLRHNRVAMELEEYDRRRGTVGATSGDNMRSDDDRGPSHTRRNEVRFASDRV